MDRRRKHNPYDENEHPVEHRLVEMFGSRKWYAGWLILGALTAVVALSAHLSYSGALLLTSPAFSVYIVASYFAKWPK